MNNRFQRAIHRSFVTFAVAAVCTTAAQAGTISIGSVGVAAPAHTENFDVGAIGTAANQFAGNGLTFTTLSGIGASVIASSNCGNSGTSGQYVYVGVSAPCNTNQSKDAASLKFNAVVSELSWTGFNYASNGGYTVSALLNNVVVSSTVFDSTNYFIGKTVLISGGNFNELRFVESTTNSGFFGIDNLAWNTVNVPEPGSVALLGVGLAVLVARRRKV